MYIPECVSENVKPLGASPLDASPTEMPKREIDRDRKLVISRHNNNKMNNKQQPRESHSSWNVLNNPSD